MVFFVAILIVWLCWWMYGPTRRFVHGFASLLENAETRQSPTTLLFNRRTVTGRFKDRPVMLQLVLPTKHRVGYGVVSMKTDALAGDPWKDSSLTSQNRDIDRATFDLEGRYGLILGLKGGWFSAEWTSYGWRFPGPFDLEQWRKTLTQMHIVVEWMENRTPR